MREILFDLHRKEHPEENISDIISDDSDIEKDVVETEKKVGNDYNINNVENNIVDEIESDKENENNNEEEKKDEDDEIQTIDINISDYLSQKEKLNEIKENKTETNKEKSNKIEENRVIDINDADDINDIEDIPPIDTMNDIVKFDKK